MISQAIAAELVFVAEKWHIPPMVWLQTDNKVRRGMLKHVRLRNDAEEPYLEQRSPKDPYEKLFPD